MSFLNKKIKFKLTKGSAYQWWRILTFIIFGIMGGSLLLSGIIVYNYTFRTLEDAHTIVILNSNAVINTVNLENFKKASSFLDTKNVSTVIPSPLRNLFNYGSTFSTSTRSATSSQTRVQ